MKRLLITLCCIIVCWGGMMAEEWTVDQVPSPKAQGQDCYVANPDGVLLDQTVRQINEVCARLNANTGVELAVVAVKQFERMGAHRFALRLFNHWGVGSAEHNTGVLLFLGEKDRKIEIITGDGVAGMLTDGKCGHILDNNLKYLSADDFDNGMLHICKDIEKELSKDKYRSELLLGWKPVKVEMNTNLIIYISIGCVLMMLLGIWGYFKMKGKPGQKKSERQDEAWPVQLVAGILMFFFPLPLLLFYIFYRILSSRLRDIPPVCPKCGHDEVLLSKEDGAAYLTPAQLFDEKIDSYQHEVWHCTACGEIEIKPVNGKYYYKYDLCPKCGANAMDTVSREVLKKAKSYEDGQQRNTRVCQCCGFKDSKILKLKKDYVSYTPKSDDDFWGSSSSSSSSWGGRSSGSSGSWGGGRSSGGGAGRSF